MPLALLLTVALMSLNSTPSTPAPQEATLILQGGRIWTGDPANPWAEALAVKDDRILAVGSRDGGSIAFGSTRSGGGGVTIWAVPTGGGSATRLVETPDVNGPRWSPDSEWIAFSSQS